MRQPLTSRVLPIQGEQQLVATDRTEHERSDVRFLHLHAVNTSSTEQLVTLYLDGPGGEVPIELSVPPLNVTKHWAHVVTSLPVLGANGLRIAGPDSVMVFGYAEGPVGGGDAPGFLDPLVPQAEGPRAPFALGTGHVGLEETDVHHMRGLEEISLSLEVPAGATVELAFEDATDRRAFTFTGPLVAFELFDRIPLSFTGRITARASTDAGVYVYGATMRR